MKSIKKRLLVSLVLLCTFPIIYFAIFPFESPEWMGFVYKDISSIKYRTLWDWLQLLIVPIFILILGWFYQDNQTKNKAKSEEIKEYNKYLDNYLDSISIIFLKKENKISSSTWSIVRSKTINVLENIDGVRKGQVLQAIYEFQLISKSKRRKLDTMGLNFKNSVLEGIILENAELKGCYFNQSNMKNTFLKNANFCGSNFFGVDLRNSLCQNTDLSYTNLKNANLDGLDLTTCNLIGCQYSKSTFKKSKISEEQIKYLDYEQ